MAAKFTPPSTSRTVRARLIGLGGQRPDGSPDVKGIASRVGRSERTVRRYLAEGRLPESAEAHVSGLERAEAHRPRWIQVRDEGPTSRALLGDRARGLPAVQDVHGSLRHTYAGPDGRVDTRRAAADLGVSQRTVQRWLKGESRPSLDHQKGLRRQVRSAAASGKRGARMSNQGAKLTLTAVIQISGDRRVRTIGHQSGIRLSGAQMDAITRAYAAGGDRAANRVLAASVASTKYGRDCGMDSASISAISEVRFQR